jgi:anti-sigma regulatory factor (Ser/Thr protein kinase)
MKEMTVDAIIDNIPAVTDFINEELEARDFPAKELVRVDIAIDEIFGNICRYAYRPEIGQATVRIEVEGEDPASVVVTFIDKGKPYNPLDKEDPDVTLSADDRGVGGLGIYLVKKSMDDVIYEYKDDNNILKIVKKF